MRHAGRLAAARGRARAGRRTCCSSSLACALLQPFSAAMISTTRGKQASAASESRKLRRVRCARMSLGVCASSCLRPLGGGATRGRGAVRQGEARRAEAEGWAEDRAGQGQRASAAPEAGEAEKPSPLWFGVCVSRAPAGERDLGLKVWVLRVEPAQPRPLPALAVVRAKALWLGASHLDELKCARAIVELQVLRHVSLHAHVVAQSHLCARAEGRGAAAQRSAEPQGASCGQDKLA